MVQDTQARRCRTVECDRIIATEWGGDEEKGRCATCMEEVYYIPMTGNGRYRNERRYYVGDVLPGGIYDGLTPNEQCESCGGSWWELDNSKPRSPRLVCSGTDDAGDGRPYEGCGEAYAIGICNRYEINGW